jgi:cyclopropane fatty-acyl-phospholipid synthase-like methyltransferase
VPQRSLYTRPALYDAIHGAIDTGVLFHFYSKIIAKYGTPVLELGCGTGRLLVPLVRQGMDVIGLGSSRAMLRAAQRKAAANDVAIQAVRADMRC